MVGRRTTVGTKGASRVAVALIVAAVVAGSAGAAALLLRDRGPGTAGATSTTRPPTTTAPPTTSTSTSTTTSTTTTVPPTTAPPTTSPPEPIGLRPGAEGPEVLALQTTLESLGFWLGGADGRYAHLTQQAVLAFQKASGLARDGIAGPQTLAALATATRPAALVVGDGLEIDLARQLLLVVRGGQVTHVLNTSTGRSGWRTPVGDFTVYREIDGMRHAPLGDLYRPKYFNGGIAVHGSTSIPGQPASHGCVRVSFAAMDMLWSSALAEVGTRVVVY